MCHVWRVSPGAFFICCNSALRRIGRTLALRVGSFCPIWTPRPIGLNVFSSARTKLSQYRQIQDIDTRAHMMVSIERTLQGERGKSPNAESVRSIWRYVLEKIMRQVALVQVYTNRTNFPSWSIGLLGCVRTVSWIGRANWNN